MQIKDVVAKLKRRPFRSFVIELDNGTQVLIDQDSELFLPRKRPELVIAFTGQAQQHEFEVSAISRLFEPP
jgi:hypothetical protein